MCQSIYPCQVSILSILSADSVAGMRHARYIHPRSIVENATRDVDTRRAGNICSIEFNSCCVARISCS